MRLNNAEPRQPYHVRARPDVNVMPSRARLSFPFQMDSNDEEVWVEVSPSNSFPGSPEDADNAQGGLDNPEFSTVHRQNRDRKPTRKPLRDSFEDPFVLCTEGVNGLGIKIDTPSSGYKAKIQQRKAANLPKFGWERILEEDPELYFDPWHQVKHQARELGAKLEREAAEEEEVQAVMGRFVTDLGVESENGNSSTHVFGSVCRMVKRLSRRVNSNMRMRKGWKLLALTFVFLMTLQSLYMHSPRFLKFPIISKNKMCTTEEFGHHVSTVPRFAFPGPEETAYRIPDTTDTFANYNYRNHSDCQISSLDLHSAFAPLCATRAEFLEAYSGGGRIGFNAPFMPRGCDMRWFSTEEVCEIFSRFEKVIVVGDSMMRHVVGALNVLLRKDLGYGAVTNWNFNEQEERECFCNHQMDVKSCSVQGIFSTSSVLEHNPDSLACSSPVDLVIEMMLKFPLDLDEVARFQALLSPTKLHKPYAFVFGHGLWNDLDLAATLNWLDGILSHTLTQATYLDSSLWPRVFVTPNAAGIDKPDQWLVTQGDKPLQIFENSVRVEAGRRGVEHMGTWNMSVQASKYDGVHLDLKGNLVKAMGVVNWLALVDVEKW